MIAALPRNDRLRLLQHQPNGSMQLGCGNCPHLEICGGISIAYPIMNCHDLCECEHGAPCSVACPRRPEHFLDLLYEVDGFDLMSLPVAPIVNHKAGPPYVPVVYSRASRCDALTTPVVAIPLSAVFSHRTGRLKFASRVEVLDAFRVDRRARLVLSGVDEDENIEPYWSLARDAELVKLLAQLEPDLVTVPNFSLLANVSRHDNLINMKRIAIACLEILCAGIPCALHLNARTARDWARWAEFLQHQPGIRTVAFEFATGARINRRGDWYVEQLLLLANRVGRPLDLVTRGGPRLAELSATFGRVTLLDTTAYSKSVRRFRAIVTPENRIRWRKSFTLQKQPIDHILQHNVDASSSAFGSCLQSRRAA